MTKILTFSLHNNKMLELAKEKHLKAKQVVSFDLPAGYACPAANECKSFADRITGKITDGDKCKFRCYAANVEAYAPSARRAHWRNYEAIVGKSTNEIADLILSELPINVKIVRIHASGDYFTRKYFLAWVKVALARPDVKFYGYTKILPYVNYPKPDNFRLVYSHGGKMDSKVTCEPIAYVVKNIAEALKRGLKVACVDKPSDDYDFIMEGRTFALCLHGTQPAKKRG